MRLSANAHCCSCILCELPSLPTCAQTAELCPAADQMRLSANLHCCRCCIRELVALPTYARTAEPSPAQQDSRPDEAVCLVLKRKGYTFWHQSSEKPGILPGCPGLVLHNKTADQMRLSAEPHCCSCCICQLGSASS